MKTLKFVLTLTAVVTGMFIVSSCTSTKPYKVYWEKENSFFHDYCLYMEMPWPSIGIANINKVNWGFKLSDAINDAYRTLKKNSIIYDVLYDLGIYWRKGPTISLYARFNSVSIDKYGNRTVNSEDYFIAEVSMSEVKKYQSSRYFDSGYSISTTIGDIIHGRR